MLDANKFIPAINPKILETESEFPDPTPQKSAYATFSHNESDNFDKDTFASNENYEFCPNCSRKFFIGRLKLHLKSCKEGKPLKIVKSRPALEPNSTAGDHTDITGKSGKETNGILETAVSFRDMPESHEPTHNNYLSPGHNSGGDFSNKIYDASDYQQGENNEQKDDEEAEVLDLEGRARNSDGRIECTVCHRFFMEDRILKHEIACKKGNKKRPVFNTKKQRELDEGKGILTKSSPDLIKFKSRGSEMQKPSTAAPKNAAIDKNDSKEEIKEEPEKKLPKWKIQHENFIRNIRFNKQLKEMEANGEDTTRMQPPEDLHSDYVPCPYCQRKFAPGTADRHIPKCKNIFNRPKPPRTSKPEDLPNGERTRATFIIKKNSNIAKKLAADAKQPSDPDAEPIKYGTVTSDQKAKSTVTTYRQNVSEYTVEEKPKLGSPREIFKQSDAFGSMRSKIHSQDSAGKQITGLKATAEERGTYTSHRKGNNNDYRSLSPVNIVTKDGKRMVFMENLPKKEDLLVNYEHIITRSAQYSTEQCPHCFRKFAPRNAERHIPICKNLRYRVMSKTAERDFSSDDKAKLLTTQFGTKTIFRKKISPINVGGMLDQKVNKGKIVLYPSDLLENEDVSKEEDKTLGLHIEGTKKIAERPPLPRGKEESQTAPDKFGSLKRTKLESFCTSCGNKMGRMHNFCGKCGSKKQGS